MKQKVEDIYKKVTQVEHVLLRPDTYIGSIEVNQGEYWVWDQEGSFQKKEIEISQGLYKIFDEILVNAADNFQRDKTGKQLSVSITPHQIVVENDGKGIPIQIHKEMGVYVPEMIFGHLLTSSNYDDSIKKVTGGRNGFGAKLTNIFSKRFTLETADKSKTFKMTWSDNMSKHTDAEITDNKASQFTRITFRPDFARFGIAQFGDDMIQLLNKRVADMAGILGPAVKVSLNSKRVPITGFKDFIKMFNIEKYVFSSSDSNGRRWDVAVSHSDGQLNQVSFVNSINTVRGGTHVNHVVDQISEGLATHIKKKHKDFKNIKPFQIKAHLFVFVNCLIENPSFDSQTKETLIKKASEFGSKFELSEKFLDEIIKKTEVVNNIVLSARSKLDNKLAKQLTGKKQSRILGIEKLEDANDAGTKYADQCTLILTEGDSAKSLAMAGIEVVGRDRYGVFPLRGKLLNVRDASSKQIMENKEIEHVVKILGLKFNQQYESTKNLRYGSVMIMTDQDHDGHHIKGLIINLFDKFWPSLLKHKGFLKQFITPILKASYKTQQVAFFSIGEYKQWNDSFPQAHLYKVKYYKGLGTSTDQEGQQYFSQLNKHVKPFKYVDQTDQDYIDLVFNKSKADARKDWLLTYSWKTMMDTLDYTQTQVRYKSFITDCLALYSVSDNIRSLPSQIDGLKPTQRKILYTLLTHAKQEYKVSSLSGLVSTHTNYHHGEQSLQTTVVTMAQSFTGANNINLLLPLGQFGTRAQAGKDAASARYIFTRLSPLTNKLFIDDDLHTYTYLEEEGSYAEPIYFAPIIPMVLVNGAEGIGTGWSTNVPQYNPREIVTQLKKRLHQDGMKFDELTPWYKGYTGQIVFNPGQNSFTQRGKYIRSGNVLFVVEIPVRKATKEFQSFLQSKMESDDNLPDIVDLKEYHAGNKVCFEIHFREGFLEKINDDALEKYLKLNAPISLTNLVLFDQTGILKRHNGTSEIMEDFFGIRMSHYKMRKEYLVSKVRNELDMVENKIAFLEGMVSNTLNIRNLKKADMIGLLQKYKLKSIENMTKIISTKPRTRKVQASNDMDDNEDQSDHKSFDYLLGMPFWSFSEENITKLKHEQKLLKSNLSQLQNHSVENMWEKDLDEFLVELDKQEHEDEEEHYKRLEKNAEKLFKGGSKMLRGSKVPSFHDHDDDDEDDDDEQPKKKPKIMMQVIKEFGNLGLSSKRSYILPVQLTAKGSKKNKVEEEGNETDPQIDLELNFQNENVDKKPNGTKEKVKKQEVKKTKKQTIEEEDISEDQKVQSKPKRKPEANKKKIVKDNDDDGSSKKQKGKKQKIQYESVTGSESDSASVSGSMTDSESGSESADEISELVPKRTGKKNQNLEQEVKPRKRILRKDDVSRSSQKKMQQIKSPEHEENKQSRVRRNVILDSEDDPKEQIPKVKQVDSQVKTKQVKKKINDYFVEQKENLQNNDPLPEKKIKREDEQLYEKYGLGQFLKYLTNDDKPAVSSNPIKNDDPLQMTLAERLLLRQRESNINQLKQSYDQEKAKLDSAKKSVQKLNQEFNILELEFD